LKQKKISPEEGERERERETIAHIDIHIHIISPCVFWCFGCGYYWKFSFCCSIAALVILCGVNSKLRAFFLVQGFASSVDQEFSQLLTRSEVSSLESRVRRRRRRRKTSGR
jgi:hypothetical protein